jgi:hypothetical protein
MKRVLKDIAAIRSGYPFRGKVEAVPRGTHAVIQIKDVDPDRRLAVEGIDQVRFAKPVDTHLLREGDVLFLSRGHRPFAAVVPGGLPPAVAASYFFVVRLTAEGVLPEYLAWYINQPLQGCLQMLSRGSNMPLIKMQEFEKVVIDVPPLAVQERIVALDELARRERALCEAVTQKRFELAQAVATRAARGEK